MPAQKTCIFFTQDFTQMEKSFTRNNFSQDVDHVLWNIFHAERLTVLTYDKVLIPVNAKSCHWILLSLDINSKTITIYDSLWEDAEIPKKKRRTNNNNCKPEFAKQYLQQQQVINAYFDRLFRIHKRSNTLHFGAMYLPKVVRQLNSVDCGIWMCAYVICIWVGFHPEIDFKVEPMWIPDIRRLIFVSINWKHVAEVPYKHISNDIITTKL